MTFRSTRGWGLAKPKNLDFDTKLAGFEKRQLALVDAWDSGAYKFILYGGALGGGKSYLLRWFAVRYLMKVFLEKGLTWVSVMLACENYPSLKDRQLQKIAQEFPEWLGRNYADHRDYGRCFILAPAYGNGVIVFRNLDDPSKYASSEFAAILVDELTKNAYEVFTFLRTRLRWPGIPDMQCPFIGGTNPGSVGHGWCKALWMDKIFGDEWNPDYDEADYRKTFLYVPSKVSDNPHIDKTYVNSLKTLPENIRKAFLDGDWNVFIGQAFQEWNEALHVLKEPLPIPDGAPIIMTFDEGFGAPFEVQWWWVDGDNRIYLFDEWYGWSGTPNVGLRMAASDVAKGIRLREQNAGIWGKVTLRLAGGDTFQKKPNWQGGGQGPSTAEVFRDNGLTIAPGDPNRRVKIMQFHERLRYTPGEMPMMMVYPNCTQFRRTIPNLIMDEHNIEDIDTKSEDHIYDSSCLIMMSRPIGDIPIVEEKNTVPKDITDVARIERAEIFKELDDTEGEYAFW